MSIVSAAGVHDFYLVIRARDTHPAWTRAESDFVSAGRPERIYYLIVGGSARYVQTGSLGRVRACVY
jgi:hypothetical protein